MSNQLIGRMLRGEKYRLTEALGQGGMAQVYQASSRSLGIPVSIKVLAVASCADGSWSRHFSEAFHPGNAESSSLGIVTSPGPTGASCDQWQEVYFAERQAAGLPPTPSVSGDRLDLRATIRPDGSVDVVETQRFLFTYGRFDHLQWQEPIGSGQLSDLRIQESRIAYPIGTGNATTNGSEHHATVHVANGSATITWWFPPVASPAERTYTIRYHLDGAVQRVGSTNEFRRQILEPGREGPVWNASVQVTLPNPVPPAAIKLSTRGASARSSLPSSQTASFVAHDVPTDGTWRVGVSFP